MAKTAVKKKPVQRLYESETGKKGLLKTNIYTTSPRTEIVIFAKLDDATNEEIRFKIDEILKEKGL